jgi:hypothetical protein
MCINNNALYRGQFVKFEIADKAKNFQTILQFTLNQTYFDRNNY